MFELGVTDFVATEAFKVSRARNPLQLMPDTNDKTAGKRSAITSLGEQASSCFHR